MNGTELEPTWGLAVLVLALLGLVLFLAAIWSGRWGVWVAAYLCMVLAVTAAVLGQNRKRPEMAPPSEAAASPSPSHGVSPRLDQLAAGPVDRRQPVGTP